MGVFGLVLMVVSFTNNSGPTFKGEGENWRGEIITKYDFWGNESQSIRITYKGKNLEQLSTTKIMIDCPNFGGREIGEVVLDSHGTYFLGDAYEIDSKTPYSSKINLLIEGDESETISLSVSS